MKKILLGAFALVIGMASVNAQDEPTLTKVWSHTLLEGNFTKIGADSRTMTYANDKLYFADRVMEGSVAVACNLQVYNAVTGEFIKTVGLPTDIVTGASYPNNTIRTDAAGNLILMNMVINIQTGNFQVWSLANEDATAVKKLDYTLGDMGVAAMRIDFASIYGDINGNGYIIAAISGTDAAVANSLLKWKIVNGVVSTTAEQIVIKEYFPASAVANGTAPFVLPISDDVFYLDGHSCLPSLYDMTGTLIDGFSKVPAEVPLPVAGSNGVAEFKIGADTYVVVGANNHGNATETYPKNSFGLYNLGASGSFENAKYVATLPTIGMGETSNTVMVVLPIAEQVDANNANIYLYAYNNGFAKYTYGTAGVSIKDETADAAITVVYNKGKLELSEVAKSVSVYSLAGQLVGSYSNVAEVVAPVAKGVYVVKAVSQVGVTSTQKVIVR